MCRINGLNASEELLILGENNLYFISNYFQKSNGEITTIWDQTIKNERDLYIRLLSGKDMMSKDDLSSKNNHKTKKWSFNQILSIYRRSFLFRDVGLELFFNDGQNHLITLSIKERELVYKKLCSKLNQINYPLSRNSIINDSLINIIKSQTSISRFNSHTTDIFDSPQYFLKKWKNGEISNFHYLMIINTLSGRTYNDLTQYPIFPWVLADYSSEELDFTNPKSFRDFSKPMGAQNPTRRSKFEKRFKSLQEIENNSQPPFHYGTHYSSAMIVSSYLIRLKPFVDSYLFLQGGSFDHADRLFYSIKKTWLSSSQENMTDVRELIPEFFYLPEFLVNSNNYNFGIKQENNELIDSVILPPWAKDDPKFFIKKHREALESNYVSEHLNEWIDLVFGFKQQGELAIKATNIFHHLSYHGAIDIDKIKDPIEKIATIGNNSEIGIIYNFGQTPKQLFRHPHPKKVCDSENSITPKTPYIGKFEKNINSLIQAIMFLKEPYTLVTGSDDCIIYIWYIIQKKTMELEEKSCLRGHSKPIISIDSSQSFSIIVSGSEDGLAIEWDLNKACYIRTLEQSDKPIQCVSINDTNGDIATCSGTIISIWTINGDLLLHQNIQFNENDMIFSCKFYEGINDEWIERDLIFTGHGSGIVQIWDLSWKTESGKLIRKLVNIRTLQHYNYIEKSLSMSEITALCPSGELRSLFTGDRLGNVYIWNLPDTIYKSHYLSSEKYNSCFTCGVIFAIIDRKHNCHPCGAILCSTCIHQHPKIGNAKLCINCISSLVSLNM
ncbi:hypothetical protein PMAC_002193 [Pneumocystis sp. 'macacae']|nr:hypothetical protein PMAC_002193 [Pneumocystis sp. 'macacae']